MIAAEQGGVIGGERPEIKHRQCVIEIAQLLQRSGLQITGEIHAALEAFAAETVIDCLDTQLRGLLELGIKTALLAGFAVLFD